MSWVAQVLQSFAKPLRWWVVIAAWEQGVLVRMGKRTHRLAPGIHFRMPFLDRVYRICVRDRMIDTDARTITTLDGKALTLSLSIRYSVGDAREMIENVARPEGTLRSIIQAQAAEFVASRASKDVSPRGIQDYLPSDPDLLTTWGLRGVSVYVVTFTYARTIRLLNAHDHGYGSSVDGALDDKPAVVD